MINPLIGIPSPMDIKSFWERLPLIKADKLIIKYLTMTQARALIRDYFLTHDEYTHLVLLPDDLLVNNNSFDSLKESVERNSYDVLSGVCNVYCRTEDEILNSLNISIDNPVDRDRTKRVFRYEKHSDIGIIRVKYVGLSLAFIGRGVIEKIPFEGDLKYQDIRTVKPIYRYNMNSDAMFCNNCIDLGIPIYVDTRVKMLHLRHVKYQLIKRFIDNIDGVDDILVGKKKPDKYIIKSDGQIISNPFEWPSELVFPKDQFDMTNSQETYI